METDSHSRRGLIHCLKISVNAGCRETTILPFVVAIPIAAGVIWLMMRIVVRPNGLHVNGSNVDVKRGEPGGASGRRRAAAAAAEAAAEAEAAEAEATERAGAAWGQQLSGRSADRCF
jgi:hypothetical protein